MHCNEILSDSDRQQCASALHKSLCSALVLSLLVDLGVTVPPLLCSLVSSATGKERGADSAGGAAEEGGGEKEEGGGGEGERDLEEAAREGEASPGARGLFCAPVPLCSLAAAILTWYGSQT